MRVLRDLLAVFTFAVIAHLGLIASSASAAEGPLTKVSLTAVVTAGAESLSDVEFTVTSVDSTAPVQVKALSDQGPTTVEVPSGRYKVMASYGHTTAEKEISVGGAPSSHEISLNAGTVFLKLIKSVGGPMIKSDLDWEILTYGKDASGNRHLLASSKDAQARFVLPEGYYIARATKGTQAVKHTIEVTSGVTYKYTVILQ